MNIMRAAWLRDALERLTAAIRQVESELAAMNTEHDALASHICVSRRSYRNLKKEAGAGIEPANRFTAGEAILISLVIKTSQNIIDTGECSDYVLTACQALQQILVDVRRTGFAVTPAQPVNG
jgi:hypothetical protein